MKPFKLANNGVTIGDPGLGIGPPIGDADGLPIFIGEPDGLPVGAAGEPGLPGSGDANNGEPSGGLPTSGEPGNGEATKGLAIGGDPGVDTNINPNEPSVKLIFVVGVTRVSVDPPPT